MKKLFIIFLIVVSSVFLFATGESESGPIMVGVAGPYTGDLTALGVSAARGVQIVVDDLNSKGGVLGRKIKLVIEDEQCEPAQAANVAAKFVGDKVVAVIGHSCSGATRAGMDLYKNENLVVISPSATNPELTSGIYSTFFRTVAPDTSQAKTWVDFLQSKGVRNVAFLHDKGDYGKGLAEYAKEFAQEAGINSVLFEGITPGGLDYSAIVLKISNTKAQAVVFGGYYPEASKLISQIKTQKLDVIFVSGDGVKNPGYLGIAKQDAEGTYVTGPKDVSGLDLAKKARTQYVDKYGEEPGSFFNEGYSAALVLFGAMEKAKSTSSKAVMAALRQNSFDTPIGKISFDKNGDVIGSGFSVYEVKNGKFVEISK